jgi:hypothetical protein
MPQIGIRPFVGTDYATVEAWARDRAYSARRRVLIAVDPVRCELLAMPQPYTLRENTRWRPTSRRRTVVRASELAAGDSSRRAGGRKKQPFMAFLPTH